MERPKSLIDLLEVWDSIPLDRSPDANNVLVPFLPLCLAKTRRESRNAIRRQAESLVAEKQGVNDRTTGGYMLLQEAIKDCDFPLSKELLDIGASVWEDDHLGRSAIYVAFISFMECSTDQRPLWTPFIVEIISRCDNLVALLWAMVDIALTGAQDERLTQIWEMMIRHYPGGVIDMGFHFSLSNTLRNIDSNKIPAVVDYYLYQPRKAAFKFHPLDILFCVCLIDDLNCLGKAVFTSAHRNVNEMDDFCFKQKQDQSSAIPQWHCTRPYFFLGIYACANWFLDWLKEHIPDGIDHTSANIHLVTMAKIHKQSSNDPCTKGFHCGACLCPGRKNHISLIPWAHSRLRTPHTLRYISRTAYHRFAKTNPSYVESAKNLPKILKEYLDFENIGDW